jgi:hypothetical protein
MNLRRVLITAVGVITLIAGALAQTTTKKTEPTGTAKASTTTMTGEVVLVDGNSVLVKMQPGNQYRIFNVQPDRQFIIDGQPKTVRESMPGTVLTATVTTTAQPVTDRTTTVTNGTVLFVDKNTNHLVVKLDNGESRTYDVPEGFKFTVEGKQTTIQDLRQGMHLSATKIVSEPRTEISKETVVTGKSPK